MTGGEAISGRVKIHAAPMALLSSGPPTTTVRPSDEIATDVPCSESLVLVPDPISGAPCWLHAPLLRVNTHAPPTAGCLPRIPLNPPVNPPGPPATAVFPSPESATACPR